MTTCHLLPTGHCLLLLSLGFISPPYREMGCHVPHDVQPALHSPGVLRGSARLCLVALGTFVSANVLPAISSCRQALLATLNSSMAGTESPRSEGTGGHWCLSFSLRLQGR